MTISVRFLNVIPDNGIGFVGHFLCNSRHRQVIDSDRNDNAEVHTITESHMLAKKPPSRVIQQFPKNVRKIPSCEISHAQWTAPRARARARMRRRNMIHPVEIT